jgi:kinesin family protein 2/24
MTSTTTLAKANQDQTRLRIERMEADRRDRRLRTKEARVNRAEEERRNLSRGNPGDVDFIGLVRRWREEHAWMARPHDDVVGGGDDDGGGGGGGVAPSHSGKGVTASASTPGDKICVCVRKRCLNPKEILRLEHDAVTCLHPTVTVHSARLRVDGISKYCDHNTFEFDRAFDERSSTEDVYRHAAAPLVRYVCGGGVGQVPRGTVFAYGQTGSGKTFTMGGIQRMVAEDVFSTLLAGNGLDGNAGGCSLADTAVSIAIFEIYGGRIQDLLNDRNRLKVLEDGRGEVVVSGLEEFAVSGPREFLSLVERGHDNRTTHATESNDVSSRSHAICQIHLRDRDTGRLRGKLSLVDLAGSERGSDTKSHDRQRRTESSDINTSLLALKECIRAIDGGSGHVPYRQSKLTLILKDCFVSKSARTAMVATLSPGSSSTDHTVNTLRYADRIKEKKVSRSAGFDSRTNPGACDGGERLSLINIPDSLPPRPVKVGDSFAPSDRSPARSSAHPTKKSPVPERQPATAASLPSVADDRDQREDEYDELEDIMNGHDDHAPPGAEESEEQQLSEIDLTVRRLFEEEEELLNLHMKSIHENAELLTEEGALLQYVQGEDHDIEAYASRLGEILERKTALILELRGRLGSFRDLIRKEEELSGILR